MGKSEQELTDDSADWGCSCFLFAFFLFFYKFKLFTRRTPPWQQARRRTAIVHMAVVGPMARFHQPSLLGPRPVGCLTE